MGNTLSFTVKGKKCLSKLDPHFINPQQGGWDLPSLLFLLFTLHKASQSPAAANWLLPVQQLMGKDWSSGIRCYRPPGAAGPALQLASKARGGKGQTFPSQGHEASWGPCMRHEKGGEVKAALRLRACRCAAAEERTPCRGGPASVACPESPALFQTAYGTSQ